MKDSLKKFVMFFEEIDIKVMGQGLKNATQNTIKKRNVRAKKNWFQEKVLGRAKRGPVFEKEEDYRAYVKGKLEEVYKKHCGKKAKRSKAKKDR